MNCEGASAGLVGFHFGTVEGAEREALEGHLMTCRACLSEYLSIKRAVESPEEAPMPSELSRARLRRAVEKELRRGSAPWSWWERPLVVGLAAASVWLALGAVHVVASQEGRAPHSADRGP